MFGAFRADFRAALLKRGSAGCLVVSGGRVRPYRNAASREYMEAEDTTGQWFEECAEIKPESWTLIGLLYRSYTEWTKENGLTE
jgi:hypothetical protein